ncbi:DUF2779 domain-containing protein [Oceanispirochaeta sp.]|jgi:hypothetical protein|uniref:DUF2779 domain-containing protein n=1 Tax=Oceanispirochaeta sp. TaxID=2035350 RepID=UPI00261AA56D|nr:DUF2779 domain-containing protein [Oceanispirochaeta sp.]MDA3959079.1 DUF2779 domain-containing protein [Oceanispirochaeta sp.]
MHLSKSLYIRGLQCTKSLWFKIHQPELLSDVNPASTRKEQGKDVGKLAWQLFPDGIEIPYTTPEEQITLTQAYQDTGAATLFEATFEYDDVQIMVDIFQIDNGLVDVFEVKSTTGVKKTHLDDLSIQYYVLSGLGFNIKSANIINLNNDYVREEELDINQLFLINDVTKQIKKLQSLIPETVTNQKDILHGSEPVVSIGAYCTNPYPCEARKHCWQHIPSPSVFDIAGLTMEKKMAFYNQGIVEFHQITDYKDLNPGQMIQVSGETIIDKEAISQFLSDITYPISHLDFEAFQHAIPEWVGVKPYSQIPFQYSLHIEYEDGRLEHKEFLAPPGEDPRLLLVENLIQDIAGEGSVLVYNMSFEKGILKNLAAQYPQYAETLNKIKERIVDLIIPFINKSYYTPAMGGKYSIKKVLPALIPEMENAYKDLDLVHDGLGAMTAYSQMDADDSETRTALLKYCELDTLAMVEILKVLRNVEIFLYCRFEPLAIKFH